MSDKTWEKSFWDLFHVHKDLILCLEGEVNRRDNPHRRKCDGFFTSVKERTDNIVKALPIEIENKNKEAAS